LDVEGIEVSCGGWFNFLETLRGEVPLKELVYINWYI
jgi:hypothetical protein